MELLQNFYETTLDALRDAKNDRLWFKTNTKVFIGWKNDVESVHYAINIVVIGDIQEI